MRHQVAALRPAESHRMLYAALLCTLLCAWWAGTAAAQIVVTPEAQESTEVRISPEVTERTEIRITPEGGEVTVRQESPTITVTETTPGLVILPEIVTLTRADEPITIELRSDGQVVTREQIRTARLLVDGELFMEDLRLEVQDGRVVLTPTRALPAGTYDLVLDTEFGETRVRVYNPTPQFPRTLEAQAAIIGVPEPQLRVELGRVPDGAPNNIALRLSPVYYVGQTVVVNMDNVAPGHVYSWKVNGIEVAAGQGSHRFIYTFKNPGTHVITYAEHFGGIVVNSGIQAVDAVVRPTLLREYRVGQNIVLTAPEGFSTYTWKVNGSVVDSGPTMEIVFEEPGTHRIEIIAENPPESAFDRYRAMLYEYVIVAG